jgi:signal transduction histidine kinase
MVTQQHRRWLFRLGQLAALVAMAGCGMIDLSSGLLVSGNGLLRLLRFAAPIAVAAVWLPARSQRSPRLWRTATLLAAGSVVLTALVVFDRASAPVGPYQYGPDSWGIAESFGLLGVLFVVSRRGGSRGSVAAMVTTGIAVSVMPLRIDDSAVGVTVGLFLALCGAGTVGAGTYLRTSAEGRQRVLDTVRAEQRAEFARDLHDFIAHHVTGIVVQAQGARYVADQEPDRAIMALEKIEEAGAETMAAMRRMVGVLRDPGTPSDAPLTPLAGVGELLPLIGAFNGSMGPIARLYTDGDLTGLPVEVSTSAYRVVMEALTNIRRHAPDVRRVEVWLRRTPDWLLVRVANDGAGASVAGARAAGDGKRYGLMGLRERVAAIGGRITAGPGIERGWVVDAALPLGREQA